MDIIPNHNGDLTLVPGSGGQYCPDNPAYCDECDYLMCCFDSAMCEKCFVKNGTCKIEARHFA